MTTPSPRRTPRPNTLGALAAAMLLFPLVASSGGLRDAGYGDGTLIDEWGDYVYPQSDGTYLDINGNLYLPSAGDDFGPDDLGAADDLDGFADGLLDDPLTIDPWAEPAAPRDYTRLDTFASPRSDPLADPVSFDDAGTDVGLEPWSAEQGLASETDPSARLPSSLGGDTRPGLAPELTEDGRYLNVGTGYLDVGAAYQAPDLVSSDMPDPGLLDSQHGTALDPSVPTVFDPIFSDRPGDASSSGDPIAWGEPGYRTSLPDTEVEIPTGTEIERDVLRLHEARQNRIHADEVVSPGDLGGAFEPMLGN